MGSHIFGSQSPNNSQYLVNGESYEKSARNKREVKFNFLTEIFHQIYCISNHYSSIAIPKKINSKRKNNSTSQKLWILSKKCIEQKRCKI